MNNQRKLFYDKERLNRNYNECVELCKHDCFTYQLYSYEETSTKYAIATIKIYVPECSKIVDYTDIIKFNKYMENGLIKELPYNSVGLIPNYKYVIGDNVQFETLNFNKLCRNGYDEHYLIDLQIPFVRDIHY